MAGMLTAVGQDLNIEKGSAVCAFGKQHRASVQMIDNRSPNSPRHKFDVLNYNLDLDIFHCYSSPYPKNFTASNIVRFKVDSVLNSIDLDADNGSLQIQSVGMAGVSFLHENDKLTINLNDTYEAGDTVEVSIHYQHLNVVDNAFYVSNGFVFTDCEPQGARKWFPCYDQPSDKARLTLRAKVPLNVKLGSNGSLADSVIVADSLWYTWTSRDPIATYLMVISSRVNYNLQIVNWQNPGNENEIIPFRFYYNPGENPTAMINMITPLANFYYSLFGDHPFEKDGFATLNPQFQWGGMENQTLTSLCPGCWYSSLIAHEFAHQWFGDMITCATWADLWLNEGFATYIEALWTGEVNGQPAYEEELADNAAYYLATNPGWPISDPDWAINPPSNNVLFNYSITYMKGSCVLYMYRYVVGDSLFFSSLYDYANDTLNFRYQSATIPDFIAKMNESTGQDLDWFFNEWIYQPNHPEYNNTYSFKEMENNQWNVHFQANQTQSDATFFAMPLEIRIQFEDASDTIVKVMNDVNHQVFVMQFNKQPVALTFDPNNRIILKEAQTIVGTPQLSTPQTTLLAPEPNPAKNKVTVHYELQTASDVTLLISDINGKQVYNSGNFHRLAGTQRENINTTAFKSGTYIVTLITNEQKLTEKLVIAR